MSKFEINFFRNYSTISFLNVNILLITDSYPDPMNITFKDVIGIDLLSSISIVLISDPRSFYYTSILFEIPEFKGIVLCTNAVYRLGRLFIRECTRLLTNNDSEVPTNLSIIPINFLQPYIFGEITLIPYPNGTGIGNCNWLLTKGNDPELVTFNAFLVSGLYDDTETIPLVFANPNAPSKPIIPRTLDIVCFLPSSISVQGCSEFLEQEFQRIKAYLNAKRKIVIPSFIDDSLFTVMHYLRYTKSISHKFNVSSFYYKKMVEILSVFANTDLVVKNDEKRQNSWKLPELTEIVNNDNQEDLTPPSFDSDLYFAPYPTEQFGQIVIFRQPPQDGQIYEKLSFFHPPTEQGNIGFTPNSQWPKPFHFFNKISRNNSPKFLIPPEEATSRFAFENQNVEFCKEFACEINDDLVRWMDLNEYRKLENKIGKRDNYIEIGGEIKGEKIELKDLNQQTVFNPGSIAEIGMKLREIGAENISLDGNIIHCNMPFEGDNDVSIEFNGDDILITTGSAFIESQILKVIQTY